MPHADYLRQNRDVYNQMAAAGDPLCQVASDAELAQPLKTVDGAGWLGDSIAGKNVLCLAAGGGRQSSLYAAAGAKVTVVDISGSMLELDRRAAAERGFSLRVFETTMEDLSMFGAGEFDIVIQPVSTCYVPSIAKVYAQVARVIAAGGVYVSQHKSPTSLQTSTQRNREGHYAVEHVYYRDASGAVPNGKAVPNREAIPVPKPSHDTRASRRLRETGATEYLHRWEQIIGGMCRAGFVIEDLTEPLHAVPNSEHSSFGDRACFVAPYVRIKSRRIGTASAETSASAIWMPG